MEHQGGRRSAEGDASFLTTVREHDAGGTVVQVWKRRLLPSAGAALQNRPPVEDERRDPVGILTHHQHSQPYTRPTQRGSGHLHYHIGQLDGDWLWSHCLARPEHRGVDWRRAGWYRRSGSSGCELPATVDAWGSPSMWTGSPHATARRLRERGGGSASFSGIAPDRGSACRRKVPDARISIYPI